MLWIGEHAPLHVVLCPARKKAGVVRHLKLVYDFLCLAFVPFSKKWNKWSQSGNELQGEESRPFCSR